MIRRILAVVLAATCLAPLVSADDSARTRELLLARNQEFQQEVIRVSERVYTAVGFGLSPVSMIVGDSGLVIIDSGLDPASGQKGSGGIQKSHRQAGQGHRLYA